METKKIAAGLAALVGIGTTAFGIETLKPAAAQAPPPTPVSGQNHADRDDHKEHHPEIRRALGNLNQAKNDLQHADHDFAGHREQTLDLVQRAINQCQLALRADRP